MNIWIVSVGEPLPTDGKNTRLRRMGNLAEQLSAIGIKIDWFSVSFDHYKKCQRVEKNTIFNLNDNYKLHLVKVPGYKKNVSLKRIIHHKLSSKRIYKEMNKMNNKPDLIIASMEPLEISNVASKFAKKNKIKLIVDVRDLWPEIYYEVVPKMLHPLLGIYVWKCSITLHRTMSRAKSIIGLSEEFLNYGLKYAKREKNVFDEVIPIGYPTYDYQLYKGDYTLLSQKYELNNDDFIVLFLGNFGNQFNFEPILVAAKKLINYKKIKFVLCGNGLNLDSIKERATNNIIFTGWIDKELILPLMANSSLGIAPYINSQNYTKNTPNKFGEYLSAGLPPLIGVEGLMKYKVEINECGKSYSSGEELSEYILEFYNNNNLLKKYSENAFKLYNNEFRVDVIDEKFYKHINRVVKGE